MRESPKIVHNCFPKRGRLWIERSGLFVMLVSFRCGSRREEEHFCCKASWQERKNQPWEVLTVRCRNVGQAIEMRCEENPQAGAVAAKDHDSVNACREKARVDLYTVIVDHRTVCCDAFGCLDAVYARGYLESVERYIGCQGINGNAVSRGRWPDVVKV